MLHLPFRFSSTSAMHIFKSIFGGIYVFWVIWTNDNISMVPEETRDWPLVFVGGNSCQNLCFGSVHFTLMSNIQAKHILEITALMENLEFVQSRHWMVWILKCTPLHFLSSSVKITSDFGSLLLCQLSHFSYKLKNFHILEVGTYKILPTGEYSGRSLL